MSWLFAFVVAVVPACPSDDSTNCYWDASTRGNQQGTSFVNIGGLTIPLITTDVLAPAGTP